MAELSHVPELAMNLPMIAHRNTRCWHGLALGVLVALMMHLTATTNAGRLDEPWPTLLSLDAVSADPHIVALQQRANESLGRLMQSEPPL